MDGGGGGGTYWLLSAINQCSLCNLELVQQGKVAPVTHLYKDIIDHKQNATTSS